MTKYTVSRMTVEYPPMDKDEAAKLIAESEKKYQEKLARARQRYHWKQEQLRRAKEVIEDKREPKPDKREYHHEDGPNNVVFTTHLSSKRDLDVIEKIYASPGASKADKVRRILIETLRDDTVSYQIKNKEWLSQVELDNLSEMYRKANLHKTYLESVADTRRKNYLAATE